MNYTQEYYRGFTISLRQDETTYRIGGVKTTHVTLQGAKDQVDFIIKEVEKKKK